MSALFFGSFVVRFCLTIFKETNSVIFPFSRLRRVRPLAKRGAVTSSKKNQDGCYIFITISNCLGGSALIKHWGFPRWMFPSLLGFGLQMRMSFLIGFRLPGRDAELLVFVKSQDQPVSWEPKGTPPMPRLPQEIAGLIFRDS